MQQNDRLSQFLETQSHWHEIAKKMEQTVFFGSIKEKKTIKREKQVQGFKIGNTINS